MLGYLVFAALSRWSKQNVHNLRVAMLTALLVALTQSVQSLFSIEKLVVVDSMILDYHWGHFL